MPIAAIFGTQIVPPTVALFVTIGFVIFLFRRDFREKPNVTPALWLPVIWTLLVGSRSVGQWLGVFGLHVMGSSMEEGNPLDAVVYFTLIILAFYVLGNRQVNVVQFCRDNPWFVAFLLYCLVSIAWSDFPFVAFKRWIKTLGHPAMALIVLTEPDLRESLTRWLKRSAYVLIPFSVLLIKYFPEIGRSFDEFTGMGNNCGVNLTKNGLGGGCMIFGFFFFWLLLKTWKSDRGVRRRNELRLIGAFLLMIAYLLRAANCATCSLCLVAAVASAILVGRQWVNKRLLGTYIMLTIVVLVVIELTVGLYQPIVDLTGHSNNMVSRGNLWHELLAMHTNPIFGVGFETFWLGDRLKTLWEAYRWQPTQAHNGYLETYVQLGLVGLMLLGALLASTFMKIRREILTNFEWGRFQLGLLIAILLHNWTEATFHGLALSWFVFHIIALQYPIEEYEPVLQSAEKAELEEIGKLAYLPREDGSGGAWSFPGSSQSPRIG